MAYPAEALKRGEAGTVLLDATINRSGRVVHLRVVGRELSDLGAETVLIRGASENLSSWRLEAGSQEQPIRIKYAYTVDPSLRREDGPVIEWALPNEISIKQAP